MYLVKSLQEVTSQEESFMPDISGYIRERVKVGFYVWDTGLTKSASLVYPGVQEFQRVPRDGPGEVNGWVAGIESAQESLKRLP